MSTITTSLSPKVYDYLKRFSLREEAILTQLRMQTSKMSMAQMQISPEQGQLMQLLVKLINAKRTLDIGVFTGYSALAVALSLPKDGKIEALDCNVEWTKIAKKFWQMAQVDNKINLHLAKASQTLEKFIQDGLENTFDFAFIDADKINYKLYYELSLKLIRKGGLIAIDNVLQGGKVAEDDYQNENVNAIREFNAFLWQDKRIELSMLPISDGLTLAFKC